MPNATMKQTTSASFGTKDPFTGTVPMADAAVPPVLTATTAHFTDANVMDFAQWGPSNSVVDSFSLVPSMGAYHLTITFHGTGNLTGHGNDDTYTGNFQSYVFIEPHANQTVFKNAVMTLTYGD